MADISKHATNNNADRKLGAYWEQEFCKLAAQYNRSFTENQIGRISSAVAKDSRFNIYTLPDITIWTAPGEHHEIKYKNPFTDKYYGPSFGLEEYRYKALLWFAKETKQTVMYTIHNHDLSGGRDNKINKIEHWMTIDILLLFEKWYSRRPCFSYVNGVPKEVPILYWQSNLWNTLRSFWFNPNLDDAIIVPKNEIQIGDIYTWNNKSMIFEIASINKNLIQGDNSKGWYSIDNPLVKIYRRIRHAQNANPHR